MARLGFGLVDRAVQELGVPSIVPVHTDQFHLQPSLLSTAHGQTQDAQHEPELGAECEEHDGLPDRVEYAQPEDGEVDVGDGEAVAGPVFVHADEDEG